MPNGRQATVDRALLPEPASPTQGLPEQVSLYLARRGARPLIHVMNVVRRDMSDQKRCDPCLHRAIQGRVASFYENAQFVGPGCVLRTDQDRIDNTVHRPDLLLDRVRGELEA